MSSSGKPGPKPAKAVKTVPLRVSGNSTLAVPVRESKRAKKMRIVIGETRNGELELVVPPRTPEHELERFLRDKRGWIERTLAQQRSRRNLLGLDRPGLAWRLGEPLPLLLRTGLNSARLGKTVAEQLALGLPSREPAAALESWLREEARLILETICQREARALGVSYKRIRIGGQRSNWGSCSQSGTLSFNWRLVLCPLEVIDYLVVHELCHFREMNHSKRFWDLVASRRPGYKEQERWLKRHGGEVRFWSPTAAVAALAR